MMHFKNHNNGFAFIEIMIAIALLAIFGTSLFMTQAKIFSTVSRAHNTVTNSLQSALIFPDFFIKKIEAKKQKKSLESITIKKETKNPEMFIQVVVKKIPEKSKLFKDFGDYLQLIDQTIIYDDKKNRMVTFLFTPPIDKQEENAVKAKETPEQPKGLPKETTQDAPKGTV